jgi:hypothetical protein
VCRYGALCMQKSKCVKNEHARYTFERYERWIKCKVEVLLNTYWTLNYSNPNNSSSDLILLLATHVLLKNSSVLCMYFRTGPLVGVCTLSIHRQKFWKSWDARYRLDASYLSKNVVYHLRHIYTGRVFKRSYYRLWKPTLISVTRSWSSRQFASRARLQTSLPSPGLVVLFKGMLVVITFASDTRSGRLHMPDGLGRNTTYGQVESRKSCHPFTHRAYFCCLGVPRKPRAVAQRMSQSRALFLL